MSRSILVKNPKAKINRGSILIEAILSVVILSVSIALIVQSLSSSVRSSVYSYEYTTALSLLENKMFDLLKDGFIKKDLKEEEDLPPPFERYRLAVETKEPESDQETEELKNISEVHVSTSWDSGRRKNSISLITYLFTLADEN